LIPGFALSNAATDVPSFAAIEVNVSPAIMIYVGVEAVGVDIGTGIGTGVCCGCGDGAGAEEVVVLDGIDICAPIWSAFGLTLGLAASRAATDVPNLPAIELNVSPAAIV
jgi:hypothetical protein